MNLSKHYEISLKLFFTFSILGLAFFVGWTALFISLFLVVLFWVFFAYNSTSWLLKHLDLSHASNPNTHPSLNQQANYIAQKYQMAAPQVFNLNHPLPIVMGFGTHKKPILVVSHPFFDKLTASEKMALLEVALYKIESQFTRYLEFITLFNLTLMNLGSKLDLMIVLITGVKNKKSHNQRNYILFSRLLSLMIRAINAVYIRKNFFYKLDETLYHSNAHLLLALKKAELFTPRQSGSIEPLLCPFNFANIPAVSPLEKKLQCQPELHQRIEFLQKDKNLMMESLTFS